MPENAQRCAERLLAVVPALMQALRVEMRAGRDADLTVPQFRMLVFFHIHPGGQLTQAADHLGLSLPSASKLAEGLVARALLARRTCEKDRRRMAVTLTPAGRRHLSLAREAAQAVFAQRLAGLSDMELDVLFAALGRLQSVFGIADDVERDAAGQPRTALA